MSKEKKKPEADKTKDKKPTPTTPHPSHIYRQDFIIDPNNLFWWR